MPSGIIRQIVGDKLTRGSKSKGKKFLKEMAAALFFEAIVKEIPRTQPCKKGY